MPMDAYYLIPLPKINCCVSANNLIMFPVQLLINYSIFDRKTKKCGCIRILETKKIKL